MTFCTTNMISIVLLSTCLVWLAIHLIVLLLESKELKKTVRRYETSEDIMVIKKANQVSVKKVDGSVKKLDK